MQIVLTNAEMRAADEYTIKVIGIPSAVLMVRAGESIAEEVVLAAMERNAERITVVCGSGNNGGDGYVCAETLRSKGFCVEVYAVEGNFSQDCLRAKNAYGGNYTDSIDGDIIVDCIFGTGLSRRVSGKAAEAIEKINSGGAYVVSADIPSGLNGDNGLAEGVAVSADKTVVIGEYKLGHFLNDGTDKCGILVKKDIGISLPAGEYAYIADDEDIGKVFPKRRRNSHKGAYGSACLVAGSDRYVGAAVLCAEAALRSGCGYVKLNTSEKVANALFLKFPQIIFTDECDLSAQSVAIGMGCGVSSELYSLIKHILSTYAGTLIIDADGLNSLAKYGVGVLKRKSCKVVLTPHIKEFSRLTGLSVPQICQNPVGCAKKFAKEYGVTVALKSAVTVICDGARTALNVRGNSSLAKGGSGDILAGFACGTLARGADVFEGAAAACYALGCAAEISSEQKTEYCVTAKEILANIHLSVKRLTK